VERGLAMVLLSVRRRKPHRQPPSLSSPNVLDRVIGIQPDRHYLPGEAQADYERVAAGVVAAARPRDAIEELLTRRCYRSNLGNLPILVGKCLCIGHRLGLQRAGDADWSGER
jgi:hypothetical protein